MIAKYHVYTGIVTYVFIIMGIMGIQFMGGLNSGAGFAKVNRIDNVTIASTGNATDFGDMTIAAYNRSALSNDHGGLQ